MDIMEAMDKLNKKPQLCIKDFKVVSYGDLRKHLRSKQTVTIDMANKKDIISLLPEHLQHRYKKISMIGKSRDYSKITDAYGLLEYFGSFGIAMASDDYLKYIKTNNTDIIMNIYGAECAESIPGFLKDKLQPVVDMPNYSCEVPKTIKYSSFDTTSYTVVNNIDVCQAPIYILNVNLPYEYYSTIQLADYNYCYDIVDKSFWFTGSKKDEMDALILDIAQNGMQDPPYLEIDNGVIVSTSDSHSRIVASLYLKLPYIPVCLYVSSENINYFEKLVKKDNQDKTLINEICAPYFSF